LNSKEVKLALSILPAVKALQSPIGAVYHTTSGVWGKSPHDISKEAYMMRNPGNLLLLQILQLMFRRGESQSSGLKKSMSGLVLILHIISGKIQKLKADTMKTIAYKGSIIPMILMKFFL
jgi:hypothetical protein